MKFAVVLLGFVVASVFLLPLPVLAQMGPPMMMAMGKSYRLGLRAAVISPTDTVNVNKDSTFDLGLEFDAKLNENLDTGPRIGLVSKKLKIGSSVDANYSALKFGFGGRLYTMHWGMHGSSHGYFNLYFAGQFDYYVANKTSDITSLATNPASFSGIGIYGGSGVEVAFGPNTGGFAEAGYQKTSIKDTGGANELPLDGYIFAAGARLSFF